MKASLSIQVVTLAVAGAFAFLWVGSRNHIAKLEQEAALVKAAAERADEAHRLEVAGLRIASAVEREELTRRGNYALDALEVALQKLKVKATPIVTASGTTGPVQAGGPGQPGAAPATTATGSPSPVAVGPACLLSDGDKGEIRVTGAAVRTEAGNIVVSASAEAWRLNPDARLFGGPLNLYAQYLSPQVPARAPGWGSGVAVTVGRRGWQVGPVVATPPLNLWRLQLEPSAGLTLGSGGEFVAAGMVIGRWR